MNDELQPKPGPAVAAKPVLPLLNRILKGLAIAVAVPFCLSISGDLSMNTVVPALVKRAITGQAPQGFPVIVFWREAANHAFHAEIVLMGDLPETQKAHPDLSFMVPPEAKQDLAKQLEAMADRTPARLGAELEREGPSFQDWKVHRNGPDMTNVGWYRATGDSIKPSHALYYGPGVMVIALPVVLISSTFFIWLAVKLIGLIPYFNLKKYSERRVQAEGPSL